MRREWLGIGCLMLSALACNLTGAPADERSTNTPAVPTTLPDDGTRPSVIIESPVSGSQAVVRQPFTVHVRATDSIGITQVVILESQRAVVTQPSPDPVQRFEALLPYTPTATGHITLEVVAYRRGVASDPAAVTIEVVGSYNELRNPASLDPTAGVASGEVICTVRVNVGNLNLRQGPGTNYTRIARLTLGETLTVLGRNADGVWFSIRRESGQEGWVHSSYVSQTGDCSRAPVVSASPP